MASIKHLITVQLTHSFVCLLNVFARLLPSSFYPSFPPFIWSFIPFPPQPCQNKRPPLRAHSHALIEPGVLNQSQEQEVCEKLSNITLALTKRCECPDRGNDTGRVRLNDKQCGSSPFMAA